VVIRLSGLTYPESILGDTRVDPQSKRLRVIYMFTIGIVWLIISNENQKQQILCLHIGCCEITCFGEPSSFESGACVEWSIFHLFWECLVKKWFLNRVKNACLCACLHPKWTRHIPGLAQKQRKIVNTGQFRHVYAHVCIWNRWKKMVRNRSPMRVHIVFFVLTPI